MSWKYKLRELASVIGASVADVDMEFSSISTDTRTTQPGSVFFALNGESFDGNRFVSDALIKGACAAVTTEVNETGPCLIVDDTLTALQSFAAHHRRRFEIPVIAITGSCGKTTSKDMLYSVLSSKFNVVKTKGNLNNHIGCPLSLLQLDQDTEYAIIELGANHVGEISDLCKLARPTEAAITMVAPSHLEGFGSIENIARAKGEIIKGLGKEDVFYVNNDDKYCRQIAESFSGEKVSFGSYGEVVLEECRFEKFGEMLVKISPIGELRLPLYSQAHVTNVLLAVAVGLRHGITEFETPLREACASTTRLRVFRIGDLEVIDDTYNANPASMAAALEILTSCEGNGARMAALGDMLELGDAAGDLHRDVGTLAAELGVTHLFATGAYAYDMIASAKEANLPFASVFENNSAMAKEIYEIAEPGDMLLLKGSRGMHMETVAEELKILSNNNKNDGN